MMFENRKRHHLPTMAPSTATAWASCQCGLFTMASGNLMALPTPRPRWLGSVPQSVFVAGLATVQTRFRSSIEVLRLRLRIKR